MYSPKPPVMSLDQSNLFDSKIRKELESLSIEQSGNNAFTDEQIVKKTTHNERQVERKLKRMRKDEDRRTIASKKGAKELEMLKQKYRDSYHKSDKYNIISIYENKSIADSISSFEDLIYNQRMSMGEHESRMNISKWMKKSPEIFQDVITKDCFSLFEPEWISVMLSDPFLEICFIYLQLIESSRFSGLRGEYLHKIYFLECLGMTVTEIDRKNDKEMNARHFRAFFKPKVYEFKKKKEDDKNESQDKEVDMNDDVISNKKVYQQKINKFGRTSELDLLRQKHYEEHVENNNVSKMSNEQKEKVNRMHIIRRSKALVNETPMDFGIDDSGHAIRDFSGLSKIEAKAIKLINKENEEELKKESNDLSFLLSNKTRDKIFNTMVSGEEFDGNDSSSSDDEESILIKDAYETKKGDSFSSNISTQSGIEGMRRRRKKIKPMNKKLIFEKYSGNINKVFKKLEILTKNTSVNTVRQFPDSTTTNASNLLSWIEEFLCVDIYILPGYEGENVDRQLKFTFSLIKS